MWPNLYLASQLISQRQAKHADYSTALRDGNAERNRARALMPGKQGCFLEQLKNVPLSLTEAKYQLT